MKRAVSSMMLVASSGVARAQPAPVTRLLAQPGELAAWLHDRDPMSDAQRARLEVFVKLKAMDDWRPAIHTLDDIVEQMNRNLKEIPGIEYNFSQPIRDNVAENISGQFGQIAVKLYGDDLDQLTRLAGQIEDEIAKVPGVADLGIVKSSEQPAIAVRPNRDALTRWDMDLGSLQDYAETALSGHTASEMSHAIGSETQRPIAVVVVGGTISSALLTLIVLPVSYYWASAARAWLVRRRRPAPTATT
jgi:Cu/Ag efflux pump CusA